MQVNVKELTGVLHLNLVFMIVLVLQSFLAVFIKCHKFLQVCCINHSKLPALLKCVKYFKLPVDLPVRLPSQVILRCVRTPLSSCLL